MWDMSEDAPVLDQINVVVGDMAAMVAFYELLGVNIEEFDPSWDRHHRTVSTSGELDMDLDSSTFASSWNAGWPKGQTGVVIGFRVASRENVDRVHARLIAAGHQSQQPPYDAFWGARYAVVADPEGNAVGIMSPADPARRAQQPAPTSND
jgi:uncharacterized glyoxalase superfamily protein PhnB